MLGHDQFQSLSGARCFFLSAVLLTAIGALGQSCHTAPPSADSHRLASEPKPEDDGSLDYRQVNFRELYFAMKDDPDQRLVKVTKLTEIRLDRFLNEDTAAGSHLSLGLLRTAIKDFDFGGPASSEMDMVVQQDQRNSLCYVKAFYMHMKLISLGFKDENIRKFILNGNIKHWSIGFDWEYHVAVGVKLADGTWYVLDSESTAYPDTKQKSKVITVQDWVGRYSTLANDLTKGGQGGFLFSVRPAHQFTLIDDNYVFDFFSPAFREVIDETFEMSPDVKEARRVYFDKP